MHIFWREMDVWSEVHLQEVYGFQYEFAWETFVQFEENNLAKKRVVHLN